MPKSLQLQSIEKAKGRPMLQWVGKRPLDKVEYYPAQEKEFYGDKNSKDFNKLFWGDNLQVLANLLKEYRGKVDLIYIDPPFDSKADYIKKVQLKGEKIEGVAQSLFEEKQYTDIWEKDEYLQFMYERLLLMRELLSDTGSIYLHYDWHKNGYMRLMMDEIFGEENFLNEIIWNYISGGISDRFFARKHDNLLLYAKSANLKYTFNVQKERKKVVAKEKILRDEKGEFVWYIRPNTNPKVPQGVKSYLDKFVQDVWEIPIENPQAETRTDYPTQKPEALLERIIKVSSNEGDIVADFFVGSGTTPAVAQKLGRRWLACDINLGAIQTTAKRLNQLIQEQTKERQNFFDKKFESYAAQLGSVAVLREPPKFPFGGLLAFKIYNVNDYDVFKNELEAKEIVIEMYGVEPIKRSYFDGTLDNNFVKVMPLNRVLNKMDIRAALKG